MILQSDLLDYHQTGTHFRVLWTHPRLAQTLLIDIDSNSSRPFLMPTSAIRNDLELGFSRVVRASCFHSPESWGALDNEELLWRKKVWRLIESLARMNAQWLSQDAFQKLLDAMATKSGIRPVVLEECLCRYWRGGMVPNTIFASPRENEKERK